MVGVHGGVLDVGGVGEVGVNAGLVEVGHEGVEVLVGVLVGDADTGLAHDIGVGVGVVAGDEVVGLTVGEGGVEVHVGGELPGDEDGEDLVAADDDHGGVGECDDVADLTELAFLGEGKRVLGVEEVGEGIR